ncbi:uncharacterized protein LOC127130613 [Lathyrus oleraceus]|uniref:uncharacterized protein LOC127130613 n=1 Tax=Pisum sativum TaxID=3888 RepID=UPI0021D26EA9|nr:uncharacterized protein LOC127130613 [Pisum sativum]
MDDYQSIQFYFLDEDVMYLKVKDCDEPLPSEGLDPKSCWGLIFDEVVNAYGNGIGVVIVTPQGSHIPFTASLTFTCTNNMIKEEWETCHHGLIPYKDYARRLSTFFSQIEFHHIPREENQIADALTTLSSMIVVNWWNDVPTINVMRLDRPAHVFASEEVIDGKPWYHDIKCFIQRQEYPPGASNKYKKTRKREGDLVLKKILSFITDSKGKWAPNYEGLYVVKRAFYGGALIVTTMDGEELPRSVSADVVKK